jgi:hypothetical protein
MPVATHGHFASYEENEVEGTTRDTEHWGHCSDQISPRLGFTFHCRLSTRGSQDYDCMLAFFPMLQQMNHFRLIHLDIKPFLREQEMKEGIAFTPLVFMCRLYIYRSTTQPSGLTESLNYRISRARCRDRARCARKRGRAHDAVVAREPGARRGRGICGARV